MNGIDFIKAVIKDYKIGAVTSSSKYVVQGIVREIKPGHKYIIEYGAGDGVVTKEILNCLPPDGRLIAFELNKDFISQLKKIHDRRLTVVNEDAVMASRDFQKFGLPRIDAVISGIPLTLISPKAREELIRNTYSALSEGGLFLVYQYSPLVFPVLKKIFKNIRLSFEPRNFLPYFIMRAEK